jgi:hypothetical protein
MASFSLVHGAWHGGWWDLVRTELEPSGHVVQTPDLPCEEVTAGVEEYAAVVPAADVVVGHSLGGFTVPLVEARMHVFLTAGVGGTGGPNVLAPGFGEVSCATSWTARTTPIPQLPLPNFSTRPNTRCWQRGSAGRLRSSMRSPSGHPSTSSAPKTR